MMIMKYLKKSDLKDNNVKLSQICEDSLLYDMYYITFDLLDGTSKTIRGFTEKGTIPRFDSEKWKDLKKFYKGEIKDFFFTRLFGDDGLMAKEQREDYIYLGGNFLEDGYLANRYMRLENGKTGQEQFDDNLFKLKMQVEALENKPEQENCGKHYAISDLHGCYGSYMEVMKRLTSKDHLYILGDVIDREPNGIKILQDIIRRQQQPERNPQITFLLGNHEMQFIETLVIRKNYNRAHPQNQLSLEDIYYRDKRKVLSKEGEKYIDTWLNWNEGYLTYPYFVNLPVEQQRQILNFLNDAYVILPQTIKEKNYLFVHAAPPEDLEMIKQMKETRKGLSI